MKNEPYLTIFFNNITSFFTARKNVLYYFFAVFVIALAFFCRIIARFTPDPILSNIFNFIRFFLHMGLLLVWSYSLNRRIIINNIRLILLSICSLLIMWITIRGLRWHIIIAPTLKRWLWYAYYIPLLFIPLLLLWLSLYLGRSDQYRLSLQAIFLFVPSLSFAIAVLTNDLHQQMFFF